MTLATKFCDPLLGLEPPVEEHSFTLTQLRLSFNLFSLSPTDLTGAGYHRQAVSTSAILVCTEAERRSYQVKEKKLAWSTARLSMHLYFTSVFVFTHNFSLSTFFPSYLKNTLASSVVWAQKNISHSSILVFFSITFFLLFPYKYLYFYSSTECEYI